MAKLKGTVLVNTERCKGCNLCVVACPQDVLNLNREANSKGYNYSYMESPEDCVGCAVCAYICPDACITVYRVKVDENSQTGKAQKSVQTVNSVEAEAMQDDPHGDNSSIPPHGISI